MVSLKSETHYDKTNGGTICIKCGKCCHGRPCFMHPDDVERIADFLGLSTEIFVKKYCIWDWHTDKNDFFLTLKRSGDLENIFIATYKWAWDFDRPCIFLDENNSCKIHEVKPKGGWLSSCYISPYTIDQTVKDWKDHPLLLKMIEYAKKHGINILNQS